MQGNHTTSLQARIGYRFRRRELLEEALRHRSYTNEAAEPAPADNERLEFLGDAVLNLVVGHRLMARFPKLQEGDLSRMRAALVNETQLARMARDIGLGEYLQLGKGEDRTGGRDKDSILAGAYEALIAAIYLDGGFECAADFVTTQFGNHIARAGRAPGRVDHKSRLQEMVQTGAGALPTYRVVRAQGPDHDKTFWVSLQIGDREVLGSGKSKKAAEQEAARAMLAVIEAESPEERDP